jgi:hypothetical protein
LTFATATRRSASDARAELEGLRDVSERNREMAAAVAAAEDRLAAAQEEAAALRQALAERDEAAEAEEELRARVQRTWDPPPSGLAPQTPCPEKDTRCMSACIVTARTLNIHAV